MSGRSGALAGVVMTLCYAISEEQKHRVGDGRGARDGLVLRMNPTK